MNKLIRPIVLVLSITVIIISIIFGIKLIKQKESIQLIYSGLVLTLKETGNKNVDTWNFSLDDDSVKFSNEDNNYIIAIAMDVNDTEYVGYKSSDYLDAMEKKLQSFVNIAMDNGKSERVTISGYEWLKMSDISKDSSTIMYVSMVDNKLYSIASVTNSKYNLDNILENISIDAEKTDVQVVKTAK